jgi:hypothetical protein
MRCLFLFDLVLKSFTDFFIWGLLDYITSSLAVHSWDSILAIFTKRNIIFSSLGCFLAIITKPSVPAKHASLHRCLLYMNNKAYSFDVFFVLLLAR